MVDEAFPEHPFALCTYCRDYFEFKPMDERGQGGLRHEECGGGWGILEPDTETCKKCEGNYDGIPIVQLQVGGWKHYGCWLVDLNAAVKKDMEANRR